MKILIMHHVEKMWEAELADKDTSFEEVSRNLLNYIENSDFDRVLLVRQENECLGEEHHESGLSEHIDNIHSYGYGWKRADLERDDPDGEDIRWADGCSHSEVVMMESWMEDLISHEVTVTGAFAGECVETLTTALDACGVKYTEKEDLIVGTYVDYEYVVDSVYEVGRIMEELCGEEISLNTVADAKEEVKKLILTSDNYDEFLTNNMRAIFGFEQYDNGAIDINKINILPEDAHIQANPDAVVHYSFNSVDVTLSDGKLWASGEVASLLVFKEHGDGEVPIYIESINDSPFKYAGMTIDNDSDFQKVKSLLHRQVSVNKECDMERSVIG